MLLLLLLLLLRVVEIVMVVVMMILGGQRAATSHRGPVRSTKSTSHGFVCTTKSSITNERVPSLSPLATGADAGGAVPDRVQPLQQGGQEQQPQLTLR
jgi:hypothetical protein